MALATVMNDHGIHRILLECYPEGVFVNVFDSVSSKGPVEDHYQPDLNLAKRFCEEMYGVADSAWIEVPDEVWH